MGEKTAGVAWTTHLEKQQFLTLKMKLDYLVIWFKNSAAQTKENHIEPVMFEESFNTKLFFPSN